MTNKEHVRLGYKKQVKLKGQFSIGPIEMTYIGLAAIFLFLGLIVFTNTGGELGWIQDLFENLFNQTSDDDKTDYKIHTDLTEVKWFNVQARHGALRWRNKIVIIL